jgi:hypothetical protein
VPSKPELLGFYRKVDEIQYWVDFGDILYIYRFEIMILVHVKAKSLLCYWAVRDLGIGMAQIARRLN